MSDINTYRHLSPGKIVFGTGALAELPGELDGEMKYLLVADQGLSASGMVGRVSEILESGGIEHVIFDRVTPDPPTATAESAAALARENDCGGIIALGGGSSIDAAKAAAVLLSAPESLKKYGYGVIVEEPLIPLAAIPTTAGTGSEATRVSVITDEEENVKMAIRGPHLAPALVILDPDLLATLPPKLAAETGADALTHAIEAYVSTAATPITDILALDAIEMIARNLAPFAANPADPQAAGQMLLASCLAGQAFSNATVGLVHSLGEPLGAYFHVSHGLAMTLYLPVVMEFNRPAAPARFADIARALGEDITGLDVEEASSRSVQAVKKLWRQVGLPLTFAEAGIDFRLEPQMIDDVWPQTSTRCNPRRPTAEEVEELYWKPGR